MTTSRRIDLLLKQYYGGDPENDYEENNPYDLKKLEKLKTDSLMSKSVESLRSFKEAESELRMLLFNNCDKLLEAVQVVVSIRSESGKLIDLSSDLSQSGDRLNLITLRRKNYPESIQLESLIQMERLVAVVEKLLLLPSLLKDSKSLPAAESRLKIYLKVRSEFFDNKSLMIKFPLIATIAKNCLDIVESTIVPPSSSPISREMFMLLLELYPPDSEKRGDVIHKYLESIFASSSGLVYSGNVMTPSESLEQMKHVLELYFLANELEARGGEYVDKIANEYLPRASASIVDSIELVGNAQEDDILTSGKIAGLFFANCVRVHVRIPSIDWKQVDLFVRRIVRLCMRRKFVDCLPRDNLLDSDVVHTNCCAIIVQVYEWLSDVTDTLSMEFDSFESFASDHVYIMSCIREYYTRLLIGLPVVVDDDIVNYGEADDSHVLEQFIDRMRLVKHIHNRRMISRSLDAVRDIFEISGVMDEDFDNFTVEIVLENLKGLSSQFIGSNQDKLILALGQVFEALDGWIVFDTAAPHPGGSLRERVVTAMSTGFTIRGSGSHHKNASVLKDLEKEEMVHCRRLMSHRNGTLNIRQRSIYVLLTLFLRGLAVMEDESAPSSELIQGLVADYLSGEECEGLRETIDLMSKDCRND